MTDRNNLQFFARVFLFSFFAFVSCFTCPLAASLNDEEVERRFAKAERYITNFRFNGAVHLYRKIARHPGIEKSLRAEAWHRLAELYEFKLKDYPNALAAYGVIADDFSGVPQAAKAGEKISWLELNIHQYRNASKVLEKVRYKWDLKKDEAKKDIELLKQTAKENPEFYNLANIYALLGNRYILLSGWGRAWQFCRKADELDSNLKQRTPLFKDLETARNKVMRRRIIRAASIVLLTSILFMLLLKPWRSFNSTHLKIGAVLLTGWFLLALGVFLLPLVSGLPRPAHHEFTEPVITFLFFLPLGSSYFWIFLLYSFFALLISFLTVVGLTGTGARVRNSILAVVNSLLPTVSLLILFYVIHCWDGFYFKKHIFFKKEIEVYAPMYPELFKEYPGVLQ